MSLSCKALPNLSNQEKKDSVVSSAKEFGKLLRLENLTHDLFYYCNVRSICSGGGYSHRNAIRGCAAQIGRFLTKNP